MRIRGKWGEGEWERKRMMWSMIICMRIKSRLRRWMKRRWRDWG